MQKDENGVNPSDLINAFMIIITKVITMANADFDEKLIYITELNLHFVN